jgi:hypothetical protein
MSVEEFSARNYFLIAGEEVEEFPQKYAQGVCCWSPVGDGRTQKWALRFDVDQCPDCDFVVDVHINDNFFTVKSWTRLRQRWRSTPISSLVWASSVGSSPCGISAGVNDRTLPKAA